MKLTEREREIIRSSLGMRKNIIETGNHILSAEDLLEEGKAPKVLQDDQKAFIKEIIELIIKL